MTWKNVQITIPGIVVLWSSGGDCWLIVSVVRYDPRSDDCFNVFSTPGEPHISGNWEHRPPEIVLQFIMTDYIASVSLLLSLRKTFPWWKMKNSLKERGRFVFILSGQILSTAVSLGGFLLRHLSRLHDEVSPRLVMVLAMSGRGWFL